MTEKSKEPLRGDAAWRAEKKRISDNNDAAQKRGRELRAARDAQDAQRRRAADDRERASLPEQPQRP